MTLDLIDTHCHLDHGLFSSSLPVVLDAARLEGVKRFVVPGVHPENWSKLSAVSNADAGIFPAFGIHPMHADLASEQTLQELLNLAVGSVAIGEIGLDTAYPVSLEIQERAFREQIRIASRLGLPLLIHCRRAFQRVYRILKEEKASELGGIMHAFSGSVEMSHEFIKMGFVISISGSVTWDNAVRMKNLAGELPLESLVLETDSPDITPQQYRGAPNQPAYLAEILLTLARIRREDMYEVAKKTTSTAERVLGIRKEKS